MAASDQSDTMEDSKLSVAVALAVGSVSLVVWLLFLRALAHRASARDISQATRWSRQIDEAIEVLCLYVDRTTLRQIMNSTHHFCHAAQNEFERRKGCPVLKLTVGSYEGSGAGEFRQPECAVYADGHIYVSEVYGNRVQKLTASGESVWHVNAGVPEAKLRVPQGIVVHGDEVIVVSFQDYQVICLSKADGSYQRSIGHGIGKEDGSFWCPRGLAVHEGELFVTEDSARISIFNLASGQFARKYIVRELEPAPNEYGSLNPHGPRSISIGGNRIFLTGGYCNRLIVLDLATGCFCAAFDFATVWPVGVAYTPSHLAVTACRKVDRQPVLQLLDPTDGSMYSERWLPCPADVKESAAVHDVSFADGQLLVCQGAWRGKARNCVRIFSLDGGQAEAAQVEERRPDTPGEQLHTLLGLVKSKALQELWMTEIGKLMLDGTVNYAQRFSILTTAGYDYFPARWSEAIMDGFYDMTRQVCDGDGELTHDELSHVKRSPELGDMLVELFSTFHSRVIIRDMFHDGHGDERDSHVRERCTDEEWAAAFLDGCHHLEARYPRDELLTLIRAAAASAIQSQGYAACLDVGTSVEFRGLAARPELNGKAARVLGFDAATQRYMVELTSTNWDEQAAQLKIKAANLVLADLGVGSSEEG